MNTEQSIRLTQEQFKAVINGKGWTFRALSAYWGMTPVWLSNLGRNPNRPKHWDDAVMGLPRFGNLRRNEKRRQELVDAYVRELAGKPRKATGAYRYHGHLAVGSIMAVSEDLGTMAESGMRGVIFQICGRKNGEEYGVLFETGLWDWFSPDYIDRYLVDTGLSDDGAADYRYASEEQLQADFKDGRFKFREG